ncbi:glucosidase II beta subunit-like protein-domain-containing protein [Lasiosphaeria ovina]|uniref:Endoplasmic reticulum lectin n=1 Tax=Lasiosphaeria ovina TaxID=92902 RepID=A0AAE0N4R7_9PEZI|nr:glucosidase II beta subunit-like protein-domain-containing protein [Lasiosphaeria ovina]
MRRLSLVLIASLRLCAARQPGFSVHDDLLAHPQFEVIFSDTYISESDALALLKSPRVPHATYSDASSQTDLTRNVRESAPADAATGRSDDSDENDAGRQVSETYEIITTPPSRYLCSIPIIAPPPALNQTATELAKAEEARELTRASAKGWELMNGLDGHCLYFMSGWWSYSFCYGKAIVQFHALPNAKGGPPVKDPRDQEYVLGTTYPTSDEMQRTSKPRQRADSNQNQKEPLGKEDVATAAPVDGQGAGQNKGAAPPNTELAVKGDQRYLVQRLGGGTVCDLTGRPRTIEVQYHCDPGSNVDRIGYIKEVTICTYLMMVHTPRLCADVAFLPPKETRAHPISCRHIIGSEEEEAAWHKRKTIEAAEAMGVAGAHQEAAAQSSKEASQNQYAGMTIGGVVVGGRRVLGSGEDGMPPTRLPSPRHQVGGKLAGAPVVEIVAAAQNKEDGGKVEMMTREQLEKLNLDPKKVEQFRQEIEQYADGNAWRLEVVEMPGEVPEIVGVVDVDDEEGASPATRKDGRKPGGPGTSGGSGKTTGRGNEDEDDEGSQETFFKEEL